MERKARLSAVGTPYQHTVVAAGYATLLHLPPHTHSSLLLSATVALLYPSLPQEVHTSSQQPSAAAAGGGGASSSNTRRSTAAASTSSSKLDKQATLVAAADVLLTCAVQGGRMAGSASPHVAAAATAAIQAAAERCGLSVPLEPVQGAVAPPIKPSDALTWLNLASVALRAAGWGLEAARLLLGMGPDADGGSFWNKARRMLHSWPDKAAVAGVYEQAVRQELGLGQRSSSRNTGAAADADAAGDELEKDGAGAAVLPKGFAGGFLNASRLLQEAFRLYKQSKVYAECTRLLAEYEGLRPLLRHREVDEVTLVSGEEGAELLVVLNECMRIELLLLLLCCSDCLLPC